MVTPIKRKFMGEERLFCFSLRVLNDASAKFGGVDAIFTAMDGDKSVENIAWLASRMMDAGDRYAKRHGLENPAPVNADDILDELSYNEVLGLRDVVLSSVGHDSEAEVSVQSEGNPTEAK